MSKKPSLGAALSATTKPAQNPSAPAASPAGRTKGRDGKTQVAGFFDPEVGRQLKVLAVSEDTTVQLLLAEALNMLFSDRGKPQIADTTDQRKGRGD